MSKACQKHLNSVESTAVKNFFIGRVHSKWAKQKRRQESDGFTKSSRFLWNEPETHEIQQLETKLSLATSGKGCLRNQDWCHRVYRMKPFFFEARFLLILYHPRDVSLWQASELLTPLLIRYGHRANISGFHSTNNVLCIYTIMQTAFLIFFFFQQLSNIVGAQSVFPRKYCMLQITKAVTADVISCWYITKIRFQM